jgi:hypothetical protein
MYLSQEELRKGLRYKFYRFVWSKANKLTRYAGRKMINIISKNEDRYK